MYRSLLLSLLFLPITQLSNAAVYQWTDANGQTHFGDRPPVQVNSSEVRINAAPAQADSTARERHQKMTEFLNEQQREREVRQTEEANARKQAEKAAESCQKLRARLHHMKSISTFYNLDDRGERVFVSEEENQQIRDRFRARVRKECGQG